MCIRINSGIDARTYTLYPRMTLLESAIADGGFQQALIENTVDDTTRFSTGMVGGATVNLIPAVAVLFDSNNSTSELSVSFVGNNVDCIATSSIG